MLYVGDSHVKVNQKQDMLVGFLHFFSVSSEILLWHTFKWDVACFQVLCGSSFLIIFASHLTLHNNHCSYVVLVINLKLMLHMNQESN
jgi:uncharacterized membrane protein (DUF2068 family)